MAMVRPAFGLVLASLTLTLASFGCGSDPSLSAGINSEVVVSEPPMRTRASPEAPRETVAALQACADRYALRLSSNSHGILFDIEANENGRVTSVKIKDSMVSGSDIERCLTAALERMVVPAAVTNLGHEVAPQTRSMVGVVQAAAAPIAMLPIVLVAAGVMILVGVAIYVGAKAIDAATEQERCREVKEKCIGHCSGSEGLPAPGGGRFRRCMRECMEPQGCSF